MMHTSATDQAAVLSGGKIGQNPPPRETKREAQNQQPNLERTIKVHMWSLEESRVEKILTLKPLNV